MKPRPKHYDKKSKLPWYLQTDEPYWGKQKNRPKRYLDTSDYGKLRDGGKKCTEKFS